MKKSELEYIAQVFRALRPDPDHAPVIQTTEWRRVVTGVAQHFAASSFSHIFDRAAFIITAGADTPEPAPRGDEPFERDGVWYNLTDSEIQARGLVYDPAVQGAIAPRNRDRRGGLLVDPEAGQIVDALTGEWRNMTDREREANPPAQPLPPVPREAWEGPGRRDYCGIHSHGQRFVCTMPRGHAGDHEAVNTRGRRYCRPWAQDPAPVAVDPAGFPEPVPAEPATPRAFGEPTPGSFAELMRTYAGIVPVTFDAPVSAGARLTFTITDETGRNSENH